MEMRLLGDQCPFGEMLVRCYERKVEEESACDLVGSKNISSKRVSC